MRLACPVCACSTCSCRSGARSASAPAGLFVPDAGRRSSGSDRPCASGVGRRGHGRFRAAPSVQVGSSRSSARVRRSCTTTGRERSSAPGRNMGAGVSRTRPPSSSWRWSRGPRSTLSSPSRAIPSGCASGETSRRERLRRRSRGSGRSPSGTCSRGGARSPGSAASRSRSAGAMCARASFREGSRRTPSASSTKCTRRARPSMHARVPFVAQALVGSRSCPLRARSV